MKKSNKENIVDQFLASTPKEVEYFVQHSLDIAFQVSCLLKNNKLSQNQLSNILGKEKSEISKWLSGSHNLTLKTISKLEAALNKQIIFTREEVISRIAPMIYRKLGYSFNEEQLDNLITFYTFSESLELTISNFSRNSYEIEREYQMSNTDTGTSEGNNIPTIAA